jgi:HEPN domain-containing protein
VIDVEKHVTYWQKGAAEDWDVAIQLVAINKIRHGLFFLHLALEKLLKAHVCRYTGEIAPRIHNLVRLAELSGVVLTTKQLDILAEMNPYNLEGRYPEMWGPISSAEEANLAIADSTEVFTWLMNQL